MPVTFTTDLPDASGVALDSSVQSELTADWDEELNNGEYRLEYRDDDADGDHPDYELVDVVDYDGTLERTIENLLDGEQYSIRLRTETEYVTGEWLTAEEITLIEPASDAEVVETTRSTVTVTWQDNSDFRGCYQLWVARTDYEYGDDPGRLLKSVEDDAEEATLEELQPDREYDVVVRAQTQWVRADSDPATGETEGVGLEARSVPSDGPYVEIDHPERRAPLKPDVSTIQRQPTVNGYPRVSMTVPADDRWLDDRLDDAETRVWIDGERQPVDRLEHRDLSPDSVDLQARGATQLDRRVVESIDIEEALEVAVYLIEEYTDYDVGIDDIEDIVREDVLLQLAETLAELQQAFEEIPDDIPLEWDGDTDRLVPLQTAWLFEAEDGTGTQDVSDDDYSGGEGAAFLSESDSSGGHSFETDYTIPAGEGVFAARGEIPGSTMDLEVTIDGQTVTDSFSPSGSLDWSTATIDFDLEPGSHTLDIDGYDAPLDDTEVVLDVVGVVDDRYDYSWDNEVHEDGGSLDGPEPYPDVVRLLLDEIATPLSIVAAYLNVTTDDGEGIELSIGEDGSDDWDTVTETLSHDLEYDELSATLLARVGLGRKEDLEPRDETPRLGYEARALESIEVRADLDETPVLVNYAPDKRLMDALREIMDVADAVFAALPGDDGTEIHIARIDGRPSDVDPDLIDFSVERNTEDTVDRAIVYAGAESIRRLPFQADVDEWADLPLGDGRIVRGSETVYDATDDEESLERGENYELIPNNPDGPPQIKLLTSVQEPRIDCDFKPRGEHEAADLPEEPSVIIEDAPNLASQQMADIAAFQAVEGSYTDAIIDASISVPVDQIGWNVLDALNVAALPGDRPYQTKDGDSDPASGDYRLGAGRTGQEEIQQLNDETGRLSEKV